MARLAYTQFFAGVTALIFCGVTALSQAGPASASEFCVTCSQPDASYACTVDDQGGSPGDAALKLFCITEIAKAGGHASCAVDKAKVAPCEGAKHALKVPGGLELFPGGGDASDAAAPPPKSVSAPPATGNKPASSSGTSEGATTIQKTSPPATVEDAVKDSAKATEEGLEKSGQAVSDAAKSAGSALDKAGGAIGDAAKKSWHCLKSLFSDC